MSVEDREHGAERQMRESVWWQGALFRIKGRKETTRAAIGLVEAEFWKGMATPLHIHNREDETFYILEGRMAFRRGDDRLELKAGDLFFGPRGVPHSFKVLEDGTRALVLLTPGGFEEMFIEGGQPVIERDQAPSRDYDVAHVIELSKKYGMEVIGPPIE